MLIWKGHGILIPVAAGIGLLGGWLVLSVVTALVGIKSPTLPIILGFWTSAICVWLYAITLGKPVQQTVVNPSTGEQYLQTFHRHTLFFIPAKYWVIVSVLLALAVSVLLPFVKVPDREATAGPGKKEFDNANLLLTSNRNGAAHGNTPAAKELAGKFSAKLKDYRDAGVEQQKKRSSFSLTNGEFLTYCHLREGDCVFLVQVPDLRKFDSEAKKFICTAAWHTANTVLAELPKLPKQLAVGVRGTLLYEEFITGTAVGASDNPEKGIEKRHDGMDKEAVFAFFAPQQDAKNSGAVAAEEKPKSPAASEEASTSPKVESPPSASAPGTAATTPSAAPAVAPPMASPSPAAVASAPTPAPAAAPLPTEVREWKSADGRPMKAALLRFTDATGATAHFRREDGQEFQVPVDKFSAEDQAELKRLYQAAGGGS
ncbi:hypothetical protein DES53_10652 [Roseimicrobium gellanilyticum]|uniref:Uncharacterized protein n=1 Tax=Roseimicrobium gellanilyticum TaxID=748857 RepID=A0A366HHV4_9BACT|nr:hypothetical protein [Roseimicrobium gellanilyticum]RBP42348.1 hypothetical protein DES53_10652 [Roseimicrobium gellanilyticum]